MKRYRTREEREAFAKRIDEYFRLCDEKNQDAERERRAIKPYTMSGLLYHLDLSAEELDALCADRVLSRLICGAKRRIEAYIEENTLNGRLASSAAINSLKAHFGWNDKEPEKADGPLEVMLSDEADRLGL